MKKWIYWLKWILLYSVVWIILIEKMSVFNIIIGMCISILALWYTDRFLLGQAIHHLYPLHFTRIFKYLVFLIVEIYKAGFEVLWMTIKGNPNPSIVEFETTLTNEMDQIILANSITLTPGTITVDVEGKNMKVLWINAVTRDPKEVHKIIAAPIEERL